MLWEPGSGRGRGSPVVGSHSTKQKKIQEMTVVVGCKHSSCPIRQTEPNPDTHQSPPQNCATVLAAFLRPPACLGMDFPFHVFFLPLLHSKWIDPGGSGVGHNISPQTLQPTHIPVMAPCGLQPPCTLNKCRGFQIPPAPVHGVICTVSFHPWN